MNTSTHQHGANTYVTWHVYADNEPDADIDMVRFDANRVILRAGGFSSVARQILNEASTRFDLGYHVTPTWGVVFADGREPMSIEDTGNWIAFRR